MLRFALYDFDRTIYNKDTGIQILKHIAKQKYQFWLYIPKMIIAVIGRGLNLYSMQKFKEMIFSPLSLYTKDEWSIFIKDFWDKEITYLYPSVVKQIQSDKSEGYIVGILTASAEIFIEPLLDQLPIDFLIGTRLQDHSNISSNIIGENCKKAEKVVRLLEYTNSKHNNTAIEFSKTYSDSLNDLPLFRIAKQQYTIEKNGSIRSGLPLKNKNI